jgi:acetyltransferase-like isoleucine patch superfamily enzyme
MISPLANIVGEKVKIGKNCRIDPFSTITGDVVLGDNVHIGVGACIFGGGGVILGDMVSLSPGAKIFSATEDADSGMLSNPTIKNHSAKTGIVIVGARSIIGANSVVLPGINIGEDVQVGALSLVNVSLPSGHIYAGIPAKVLREKPRLAA